MVSERIRRHLEAAVAYYRRCAEELPAAMVVGRRELYSAMADAEDLARALSRDDDRSIANRKRSGK